MKRCNGAVSALNARTQVAAFEAAKFLYEKAGPELERELLLVLENGRRPLNRAAAAYVMPVVTTAGTVSALEREVSETNENPKVRGEASEALAHAHRRKSHEVPAPRLLYG
jgi:hypothetical protein